MLARPYHHKYEIKEKESGMEEYERGKEMATHESSRIIAYLEGWRAQLWRDFDVVLLKVLNGVFEG